MRTGAIIQARMSSERTPGKVTAPLPFGSGIPSVAQVIRRVKAAGGIDIIILATSEDPGDRVLLEIAETEEVVGFAGDLHDVLDRYHQAAAEHHLDQIVRITGDCPCLDPGIIERVIDHHLGRGADFTSIGIGRTFPVGMDTAVIRREALAAAWSRARRPEDREHVTSYLYRTALEEFTIEAPEAEGRHRRPDLRVTFDTPRDYAVLCILYEALYGEDALFGLDRIIAFFDAVPWLGRLNTSAGDAPEVDREAVSWCRERGMDPIAAMLEEAADRIPDAS
jgi:spore coat polysaccharide biosynthesis protein SpsF